MSTQNILLSSVPTAKISIGNKGSIELDTATVHGKKTIKIQIMSDNDTVHKEIEDVVTEIKNGISDVKNEIDDATHSEMTREERIFEMKSDEREHNQEMQQIAFGSAIPILITLFVMSFFAFRSYQNRKWKEALLNKGFKPEEILEQENLVENSKGSDMQSFEKRKNLKNAIIFGSFGMALILGITMGSAGYFFGFLALFLGAGFYYFYKTGL
jgi:Fe2+ transport system protein B